MPLIWPFPFFSGHWKGAVQWRSIAIQVEALGICGLASIRTKALLIWSMAFSCKKTVHMVVLIYRNCRNAGFVSFALGKPLQGVSLAGKWRRSWMRTAFKNARAVVSLAESQLVWYQQIHRNLQFLLRWKKGVPWKITFALRERRVRTRISPYRTKHVTFSLFYANKARAMVFRPFLAG